jgi:tetratricopeptide (TPR) repeat protein
MMRSIALLLCMLPTLTLAQVLPGCEVIAADAETTITGKRLQQLIIEKRFSAVDDELADKLRRYRLGTFNDIQLIVEIRKAAAPDPKIEPLLKTWVNESKASFFAHLLLAQYRTNIGFEKRGGEFYSQTSQEQITGMRQEFDLAILSYQEAMKIDPKSSLPIAGLMSTMRPIADAEVAWKLVDQANRIDLKNLSARREMIYTLAPKWGGSLEAMDSYLEKQRKEGLSVSSLRYLTYITEMQKGLHFEGVTKENTKAIKHWNRALEQCQYSEPALRSIMDAANKLQDWQELKSTATRYLVIAPESAETLVRRAWANEKLSIFDEMERDYLIAAKLGSAYAQNRIGYFYMVGQPVKKDLIQARKYLEMAVKAGNTNAVINLEWLTKFGEKR